MYMYTCSEVIEMVAQVLPVCAVYQLSDGLAVRVLENNSKNKFIDRTVL